MSKSADWMPTSRDKVFKMAVAWANALDKYSERWGIDKSLAADFRLLLDDLEAKMKIANDSSTSTPDAIHDCEEAEDTIKLKMRDVKKHWFLEPKLKTKDFQILLLKPPDHVRTPGKTPTATVDVMTPNSKNLKLDVELNYLDGNPKDAENKAYNLYGVIVAPGEKEPVYPKELFFVGLFAKRKFTLQFAPEDAGCRVFLSAQVVNGSKFGPMGPIASQVIIEANEKGAKKTEVGKGAEHEAKPAEKLEPRKIHVVKDKD
jgi:hypothetical protein